MIELSLPTPPWERSARRRPTKAPLSREAIVDAAMVVLDREGGAAVTMRRVAQELDTGPASLYAHVDNKEQLENLLFDRIAAEIPLQTADPARWRDQVKQLMSDSLNVFGRHPGAAKFMMARIPYGPNALAHTESLLSLLRAGGVADRVAALAADLLHLYVSAHAVEASLYTEAGVTEADWSDRKVQIEEYLRSLPPARFPILVELAGHLVDGDGTERFEFGLDVILAGLTASTPKATI